MLTLFTFLAAKNFAMGNSLAVETERLEADLVCERLESSGERPNLAVFLKLFTLIVGGKVYKSLCS